MKKNVATKATRKVVMLMMVAVIFVMSALPAFAAPQVKKAKVEQKGVVEVDFRTKVQYRNLKITVKDDQGKAYSTRILERDDDELEFRINNYKEGRTYTYTVSGIKKRGETSYSSVSGKVTIPAKSNALKVKKVKYDREDREAEFELSGKVKWRNAKVTISDGSRNYSVRITDYDNDEIEVYVKGLTRGKTYNYTISGLAKAGTNNFVTLKGSFKA